MKQTSEKFQEVVNNTGREFQARLVIMTAGGNKTYTNNEIIEAKITHELLGEALTLGNITAKKIVLRTVAIPKYELTGNDFYLEIGLRVGSTMSLPPEPVYEWVNMGLFKHTEIIDKENGIFQITAYDKLYFTGNEINTGVLPQTATMQQILDVITTNNGITKYTIENAPTTAWENTNFAGKKERDLLGFIAEYFGGYFIMDMDKLKLITLGSPPVTIDGDIYYEIEAGESLPVNFVEKYYSQEERWFIDGGLGSGLTIAIHPDNFFVDESRLQTILDMHKGKTFLPYTVTTIGNVSAEVGDSIQINTVKGEVLETFITDYEYIYNGVFNATYSSDVQTSEKERFTSTAPTRPDDFLYKESWLEEYNKDKQEFQDDVAQAVIDSNAYADELKKQIEESIVQDWVDFDDEWAAYEQTVADRIGATSAAIATEINDRKTAVSDAINTANSNAQGFANSVQSNLDALGNASTTQKIHGNAMVTGTLGADKIIANSITASQIKAGTITANLMAAESVVAGSLKVDQAFIDKLTVTDMLAKKITADALFATTVQTVTLNASKITTGILSADRIAVGSLSGDKIIARTLSADRLKANSITSGEINAGSIRAAVITAGSITADHIVVDKALVDKMWVGNLMSDYVKTVELNANKIVAGTITANSEKFKINLDSGRFEFKFNVGSTGNSGIISAVSFKEEVGGYNGLTVCSGSDSGAFLQLGMYNGTTFTTQAIICKGDLPELGYRKGTTFTDDVAFSLAPTAQGYRMGLASDRHLFRCNTGMTNMQYAVSRDSGANYSVKMEWRASDLVFFTYNLNMNQNSILNAKTVLAETFELEQPATFRSGGLKRQVAETYSNVTEYVGSSLVNSGETFIEIPAEVQGLYKVFVTVHGGVGYVVDQSTDGFTVYSDKDTICDYIIKAEKSMTKPFATKEPEQPEVVEKQPPRPVISAQF